MVTSVRICMEPPVPLVLEDLTIPLGKIGIGGILNVILCNI